MQIRPIVSYSNSSPSPFKQVLRQELNDPKTQRELQHLLSDLLEELKLNYIQRSTQRDPEVTLHEVNRIQETLVEPEE